MIWTVDVSELGKRNGPEKVFNNACLFGLVVEMINADDAVMSPKNMMMVNVTIMPNILGIVRQRILYSSTPIKRRSTLTKPCRPIKTVCLRTGSGMFCLNVDFGNVLIIFLSFRRWASRKLCLPRLVLWLSPPVPPYQHAHPQATHLASLVARNP